MFKESKRQAITDTLIGQGTQAEGRMVSEASIRIEGEYRGDIECKGDVIIGECGIARSNVTAKDVTIAGKVYGDVVTKGRLTITASGQLHGNATAHTLLIQDGAIFNGSCKMDRPGENRGRHQADQEQAQLIGKEASNKEAAIREAASKEKARQAG
ncbi:cytoskeletal protein CcmA (bactofilin family) [Paenibacillus phyllosphaerae]|uniref:Cytoskeletal protein CcmA (Bactofilin family) n=1 Tax=Paenibacillus phyllosphaerae TaxID=274593 RepID=A0A7W5ATL0_9BACL|nr:polymer-forming cytoskeletal protein [Paenibacillus phyllosphaerae]MBB3108544.1 cytoskeletal protein CcmA (bactofilin family) [Paenibacillus phyllosphaerae]